MAFFRGIPQHARPFTNHWTTRELLKYFFKRTVTLENKKGGGTGRWEILTKSGKIDGRWFQMDKEKRLGSISVLELRPRWSSLVVSCRPKLLLLFSHQVVSDCLQPHGLQHLRLPRPSLSPGVCSNSCPLSW